ncbi:hypothetical protein BASA81_006909 [Batrachochytrium salamandrivorans]|nr:hypothetical protein BASA81_006909 [Batrachochytrium salamandrivorans]
MNSSSQFLSRTMSSVSSRLMRSNDTEASTVLQNPSLPAKKSWIPSRRSGSVTTKKTYISASQDLAFLAKQLKNVRDTKLAEQLFDEDQDLLAKVEFDNKGMTLDELHLTAVVLLERSAPKAAFSDKTGLQLLFDFVQSDDVRQLLATSTMTALHPEECLFTLLVACLCHDAGHTGLTNAIHRSLPDDVLVKEFGVESPLEKMHSKHCRELVQRSKLVDRLSTDSATLLDTCEELILSTDMEKHRELLAAFHVEPANELLGVVIKMADISNVTREFEEAKCWAKRLEAETKEHPNSPPTAVPLHKSVTGFSTLFAIPMAEVLLDVGLVETGAFLKSRIVANNDCWAREAEAATE